MIYSPPAAHMPRTHACMRARKRTCNFALWCETMPRTRRPAPLAAARRALRYMMCESVNGDLIVAFQGKPLHTLIPSGKGCMRTAAASTQSAARARSGLCGGAQGRTAWVTRSWTCACRPHPTGVWTAPASRERCPPRFGPRSVLWVLSALLAPGLSARPLAGSHRLRRARGDDTAAAVCACAAADQRRHARQAPVFLRAFDGRRSRRTRRSAPRDAGNGLSLQPF